MIAGLSKAVTLYLAPVLSLTALLLALFAFLAPSIMLRDSVALLSVTPSTALKGPGGSGNVDGPTVRIGALGACILVVLIPSHTYQDIGSCSRPNNDTPLNCTLATINAQYGASHEDLSQ